MALDTNQYGYLIDPLVPITDEKGTTIKDGFLLVYIAGSSTPVITYRNFDGAVNEKTIELDNSGRCKYPIIVNKSLAYKVVVYDAQHSQETPIITVDKMFAIGANVTVGAGATVVTGLDGLTTKPDGFVDASVVGTDGYVALDHTLVDDDLDTDAKVTAVENDRYIPLLNEDVNDPDSKMTLGRLWQWVLGKIKSLSTTATEADLVSGNYLALNGSAGTKKLKAEDVAKRSVQDGLVKDVGELNDVLDKGYSQVSTSSSWNNTGHRINIAAPIVNGKSYKVSFSLNGISFPLVYTSETSNTNTEIQRIFYGQTLAANTTLDVYFTASADANYIQVRDTYAPSVATSGSGTVDVVSFSIIETIEDAIAEFITSASFAESFVTNKGFTTGRIVAYQNKLYRFNADHYGAWTGADVTDYVITDEINKAQFSADKANSVLQPFYVLDGAGGNWNSSGVRLNFNYKFKAGHTYKISTQLTGGNIAYSIYTAPTYNTDTVTQRLYNSRAFEGGPIVVEFTATADANCLITRILNKPSSVTITGGHSDVYKTVSNVVGAEPLMLSAIGDSIVQGAGATTPQTGSWVEVLKAKLIADKAIDSCYRFGSGGNDSDNICKMAGVRPLYLNSAVTIPASGGVTISPSGRLIDAGTTVGTLVNPCFIGGIAGNISYSAGTYTFTRIESGTARDVPVGEMIFTNAAKLSILSKFLLIEIGCNDPKQDGYITNAAADNIIENCKRCITLSKNARYLVIGNYSKYETNYLRGLYRDNFGQRYVDMYGYLSNNGVIDAIAAGLLPGTSLQSDWFTLLIKPDEVHPNDVGHAIWAEYIYKRMQELGWV